MSNDTCKCSEGYTGKACSEKGNCALREIICSVPVHTCTHDTFSSSVMDNCKAYFSAVVLACEENICENGGTCSRHVNDYSCDCPARYSGILCDEGLFGHATNVVKSVNFMKFIILMLTEHMCTSAQLCTHYCTTAILYQSHTHHGTACCTMSLLRHYIQWNLRIKDKLVHGPLSTIRGLSFIEEFLSKSLFCVL